MPARRRGGDVHGAAVRRPQAPDNPFGHVLRDERTQASLTQDDLAERAGLPQFRVSYFETGKAQPTIDEVRAIERVLNVPDGELLIRAGYVQREVGSLADLIRNYDRVSREHRQLLADALVIAEDSYARRQSGGNNNSH